MNEMAALLIQFGFTLRDAGRITQSAQENNLALADVQAWIDEARASTSLHNPRGFVRARIQDGDKLVHRSEGDPHITDRHRYLTQWSLPLTQAKITTRALTQTCTCGRVVYVDRVCEECGLCPTCCECEPADQDKE